jgi:hypothetical protein
LKVEILKRGALHCCWILIFLLTLIAMNASATDTIRLFGGPERDMGNSVRSIPNDGYIIAGGMGNDIWILKTDEDGIKDWEIVLPNGIAKSAALLQNGYIVTGSKYSDLWLSKISKTGTVIWEKTFGPGIGNSVIPVSDGYVIAGTNTFSGNEDLWLLKIDLDGTTVLWDNPYLTGAQRGRGFDVSPANDGYIVAGTIENSSTIGLPDIWILKADFDGDWVWDEVIENKEGNWGCSVVPFTSSGNEFYYLGTTDCGRTSSHAGLSSICDGCLEYIDYWGNDFGEISVGDDTIEDYISEIKLTEDGDIITVGSVGTDGGLAQVIVGKYNPETNIVDNPRIITIPHSYNLGNSIDPTKDGGYAITGSSFNHVTGDDQLLLIIYHPDQPSFISFYQKDAIGWWKRPPPRFIHPKGWLPNA